MAERHDLQAHLVASVLRIPPKIAFALQTTQDVGGCASGHIEVRTDLSIGEPAGLVRDEFKDRESAFERVHVAVRFQVTDRSCCSASVGDAAGRRSNFLELQSLRYEHAVPSC